MKMLLQRKLASRFHDDALNSISRGRVDILVIAPGTINAAVLDRRAMIVRLELLD